MFIMKQPVFIVILRECFRIFIKSSKFSTWIVWVNIQITKYVVLS